jgi:WD40 repeat protein
MTGVAFHPSGRYLLSSSLDATLKVWDLRMGYALYTLYGHEGATTAVNFSPDGDYLCSGGADSVVMVWLSNLDYSSNAVAPVMNASMTLAGNKKLVPEVTMKASYPAVQSYEEQKSIKPAVKKAATSSQMEGSEELAGRLDKVVSQLNIITKTLNILEQRMRVTEGQISKLTDKSMGINREEQLGMDRVEEREDIGESATFKATDEQPLYRKQEVS